MKQKMFAPFVAILFVTICSSFTKPTHKHPVKCVATCDNSVTVYALGITLTRVTITHNGSQYSNNFVNITSGSSQTFPLDPAFQGSNVAIEVACSGAGGAPRMRSIGNADASVCNTYPGYVAVANISLLKGCVGLKVIADHEPNCPY